MMHRIQAGWARTLLMLLATLLLVTAHANAYSLNDKGDGPRIGIGCNICKY